MTMDQQLCDGIRRVAEMVVPEHVQAAERLQQAVWAYEPVERIPVVLHGFAPPEWPTYSYREIFDDPEKMFWNELLQSYLGVTLRDDRVMTVRANFGPAVIPSLFGATVRADSATTWVEGCHSSRAVRETVDRGLPALDAGLGKRVLAVEEFYRDCLRNNGLSSHIHIFQANNQGPFDCAALLWGHEIYTAMLDEPDLVHALLDLIVQTTIAFVRRQKEVLGEPAEWMHHWWYRVPAGVRMVNDMTINLSPTMYAEFVRPYNERVFDAFGGGYMHYCGHGLQSQHLRLATKGLRGIEMGAEDAEKTPAYTIDAICRDASEHRVTICWIGPKLPAQRPPQITTGLVYGHLERKLRSLEDARRCCAMFKTSGASNPSYATEGRDCPSNRDLRSILGKSFHYICTNSSIRRSRLGRVIPRR